MQVFKNILAKDFIKAISRLSGGEVYFVGGCVRDYLLRKEPKDIDIVVRNIPYETLILLLEKYGKVDVVGESFGVIKFKEKETNFEIEIALPRTDSVDNNLKGHKSIIAQSDTNLSIEKDLLRRDFTINSIAINQNLQIIDPYQGIPDLIEKTLKVTNSDTFSDDPLRMLRAVQFAARFGFELSFETLTLIEKQAKSIKEITPERILIEFKKVFEKCGNSELFLKLLVESSLFYHIFGFKFEGNGFMPKDWNTVTTLADFLAICYSNENLYLETIDDIPNYVKERFKLDTQTFKQFKAIHKILNEIDIYSWLINSPTGFHLAFDALQISPTVNESKLVYPLYKIYLEAAQFPRKYKELALTGDDFISTYNIPQGPRINEIQIQLLTAIFHGEIANTKEDCHNYLIRNLYEINNEKDRTND